MASTAPLMECDAFNNGGSVAETIEGIQDENVLRDMWQESSDPEEKRQIRSRMYKLREDRIKEYYGREGHDILESILKPELDPVIEDGELLKTIVDGNRELTMSSSETQSTDGKSAIKTTGFQVKQTLTAVTTSGGTKEIISSSSEADEVIKNRIKKKDRASQYKEIQSGTTEKQKTSRRKASSGEIEIINVKKGFSGKTRSTNSNNATPIAPNNNNKVIANNIRNGVEHNGLSVQKKSRRSEGVTKVVNGKSSVTSTTTMGGTKSSSRVMTEGNKTTERGESQNQSSSTTTFVTRQQKSQGSTTTVTTVRSSTMMTTSSVNRVLSSSLTNRKIETSTTSSKANNYNNMITSSSFNDGKSTTGMVITLSTNSAGNEQIPIGSVKIEEIVEKPLESVKLVSSARRSSASSGGQKEFGNKNKIRQTKADADVINRNLAGSSPTTTTSTTTNTGDGSQVTKSEITRTSSSSGSGGGGRTCCTKSSSVNANANTTNGSAIKDKSSKVVNKSREASPKRSSSKTLTTNPSGKSSKTSPKAVETLQTPIIKVDRAEQPEKADNNKAEESIIRELDILDTFLSQRSTSIDEAVAKEEPILIAKANGTMEADQRMKVSGGDERVDVMEIGLEPPFTRKEYKYGCPGDDHHDKPHEKNTNDSNRTRKANSKSVRDTTTTFPDTRKSNIEDEIIVDETTEIRSGKSTRKASLTEKSVKSLRQKEMNSTTTTASTTTEQQAPTTQTNLSSKGRNTRVKANIKKSSNAPSTPTATPLEENCVVKVSSTFSTSKTPSEIQVKKYEADILSRPSVFQQQKKSSQDKPDPNPRIRKASCDSSPERERGGNSRESSTIAMRREQRQQKPIELDSDENDGDYDDDLLRPQKLAKGLDSPGAVLKAKSLFETKAQEAAMDRSSADFDMDKGLSRTAKVSKKAALFEARSRGERVSISSESSISIAPEDKDQTDVVTRTETSVMARTQVQLPTQSEPQTANNLRRSSLAKTDSISSDAKKIEKSSTNRKIETEVKNIKSSSISSDTKKSENNISSARKSVETKFENTRNNSAEILFSSSRRRSSEIKAGEIPFSSSRRTSSDIKSELVKESDVKKTNELFSSRREKQVKTEIVDENTTKKSSDVAFSSSRQSTEVKSEQVNNKQRSELSPTRRSSQTRSRIDETKEKRVRDESKAAEIITDEKTRLNERRRSSGATKIDSKLDSSNNNNNSTKIKTSLVTTTTQIVTNTNTTRMTTLELNAIDTMEDIEELERLLDKATDYDERSKVRGRIRALKRKAALVKKPSTETDESPDRSMKRSVSNVTSDAIANMKSRRGNAYERRRSSGEIQATNNQVATRKKSSELFPESKQSCAKRTTTASSETKTIQIQNDTLKSESTTCSKRLSREKKISSSGENSSPETPKKNNNNNREKTSKSPSPVRNNISETSEKRVTGERKLSSETQELLSTRKYSREKVKIENDQLSNILQNNSQENEPSSSTFKILSSSSTQDSNEINLDSRRSSRDKTSPTRTLESVSEVQKVTADMKSKMTKVEKYEADILSRPSVFCKKRQAEENEGVKQLESQQQTQQRRSRDSVSPQRSEIPISSRMKNTTRESSPPKTVIEEQLKSKLSSQVSSQEISNNKMVEKVEQESVVQSSQSSASASSTTNVSSQATTSSDTKSIRKKVSSSSRKNSEELRGEKSSQQSHDITKSSGGSRKNSGEQSNSSSTLSKCQRRQSTEDTEKTGASTGNSSTKRNVYTTRKSSSKELRVQKNDSAEQTGSSKMPTRGEKGEITKDDDHTPIDKPKFKPNEEINFNQQQQSTDSPTLEQSSSPLQQQDSTQQKTNNNNNNNNINNSSTTRRQQPSGIRQTTNSSSSTRRVTSTTNNKNSPTSSPSSNINKTPLQGTETVTSSYGVGPTDDDGVPLFGLRALRKIKQVQEQMASSSSVSSSSKSEKSQASATIDSPSADEQSKTSLRSSENFGLRALKKGSVASQAFGEGGGETEKKSPESSVPQGFTRESKSEFVLSSSQISSRTTSNTSADGTSSLTEQTHGISTSPKSILKKTSSFTSQSGSIVKSRKTEDGNNSDEIEAATTTKDSDDFETVEGHSSRSQSQASTTTASSSTFTNNNLDDSSWRRKSVSPSPDAGTTLGGQPQAAVGSFSRGKVGRASVKEMSKRFETSESTTSSTLAASTLNNDRNKTSFIRADSPSRIPSPIRSTTTITTKSSVEVTGDHPDDSSTSLTEATLNDRGEQSDSDSGGVIRITRTTVTTKTSGRSFLSDQSPIQNLSDVIERMKGEESQSQYASDFKDDENVEEPGASSSSEGLNLLNKFIGAQIIMQAVEPMLVTQKVSMSSSNLVLNGVDVDSESNPAKLRLLLAEVDGEDRARIESRLRILESGSSMELKEERSFPINKQKQLTKTLSISGIQLGASDVTGELMPLILGQLQSSLDNIGASSSGSGINIDTTNSNSSINSSHNNNLNSSSTHNNINSNLSNTKCIGSGDGSGGGLEESSSSVQVEEIVGSAEECLFDSGTESGEDVAPLSSPGDVSGGGGASSTVHHAKSASSPAEFSNFMEGLRNTLKRNQNKKSLLRSYSQIDALGATGEGESALGAGCNNNNNSSSSNIVGGGGSDSSDLQLVISPDLSSSQEEKSKELDCSANSTSSESDLIQQVDNVLTLLRDSLVKDPNCLKNLGCADLDLNSDSEKGKDLIALIDRLKSSLVVSDTFNSIVCESSENQKEESLKEQQDSPLPTVIGTSEETDRRNSEMFAWAQTRPPDIVPLPWVNHMQSNEAKIGGSGGLRKSSAGGGDELPWKARARGRRSHARSHTVGVTQEELAEARRYLQESAYRSALEEQKLFEKEKEKTEAIIMTKEGGNVPKSSSNNNVITTSMENDLSDPLSIYEGEISDGSGAMQQPELVKQTMGAANWRKDVEKGLTSIPRPFVRPGMYDSGYQPPPERRMTYASIDDSSSILGTTQTVGGKSTYAKIKPFRTFSLDNAYDPSKSFFTKEETVQIAIHQAAIKKQMSDEEDRRKRRNSLSSYNNIYSSGTQQPSRDFSLALPKPYSSPQQKQHQQSNSNQQNNNNTATSSSSNAIPMSNSSSSSSKDQIQSGGDSGYTEESGSDSRQPRNDQLILYESSQMSPASNTNSPRGSFLHHNQQQQQQQSPSNGKRIENVQISLKELNSSEFPQLQIAITLNTNNGNSNNSNGSNNSNNEQSSGNSSMNIQSHFHSSASNNHNSGNNISAKQNNNVTNPTTAIEDNVILLSNTNPTGATGGGPSNNKATRYKTKNERKKRLKRANTIDIPQPSGFLLSNDDDSEMEDEEDSDGNIHNNGSAKNVQFTYAPFKPKTDGDHKFLAFLEKNNAVADNRPTRPSYLGVNDKYWNNRFFNLKSSFESSSQGSSPSPSPILSPNRHPRSVSEMALTHGITPSDTYSKPVWATTDPGQLPQQVKSKLHVFETKSVEGQLQLKEIPWRSSAPQLQNQSQHNNNNNQIGRSHNYGGSNQFISSSSVYSTNNIRPPIHNRSSFDNQNQSYDNNTVKRPVAMKATNSTNKAPAALPTSVDHHHPPPPPLVARNLQRPVEGVHMIHATTSALEAMKRSGFGPTAVVHPHTNAQQQQQGHHYVNHPPPPIPPKSTSLQEKVILPWAKKEPLSPSEAMSKDPNAGRILMSKAKFEQLNQSDPIPMHPAIPHGHIIVPPPIPPKSSRPVAPGTMLMNGQLPRAPLQPGARQSFALTSSVPNVSNLPTNYGQSSQYAPSVGIKPKLGSSGVTQSFDEAFKRKLENEQTKVGRPQQLSNQLPMNEPRRAFGQVPPHDLNSNSIIGTNNNNNNKTTTEFQRVPGSAFARKVAVSEPTSRRSSGQEEEETVTRNLSNNTDGTPQDGVLIQTPVVAKVMRGPQQQRAVVTGNRMSSLNDEQQSSRLTNARSNIRNILNQYQQQSHSPNEDSSDTSPPIIKANLQLSMPPLTKSMSGDSLLQTHFRPNNFVVGNEELTIQSPSSYNNHKLYSPPSANSVSPASIPVSPVAPTINTAKLPSPSAPVKSPQLQQLQQKPRHPVIPKQRSLAEFPKLGPAPNIGVLTIQTDLEPQRRPIAKAVHKQHHQHHNIQNQQSVPVQQKPTQQKQQLSVQNPTMQQQAPKVLKSYPTTDSLQRTSSGSSIFNRAQSLFLSAQDGMPPATKSRPKPSLPKTHGVFPKQFEAQMSPDSANKKQREIEAYFNQQQQQLQEQQQNQQQQKTSPGKCKGSPLRKSASHSKIMSRQRSLSDGEEDVDQIFESLFKASAEERQLSRAEMWASSSSKSFESSISSATKQRAFQQQQSSSMFNTSFQQSQSQQSHLQQSSIAKVQSVNNSSFQNSSSSSSSVTAVGGGSGVNRFKQMDQQAKANSGGAPLFKFANQGLKASANSAKDILLYWCQCRTRDYENVKIENFSSSWSDGLAFCALIHHFFPDAFDYNSLDPRNRRYNFDLAFRIADEKAGIYPLLDTEDMIAMGRRPDWKCVFTYVQAMYQKLKEFS